MEGGHGRSHSGSLWHETWILRETCSAIGIWGRCDRKDIVMSLPSFAGPCSPTTFPSRDPRSAGHEHDRRESLPWCGSRSSCNRSQRARPARCEHGRGGEHCSHQQDCAQIIHQKSPMPPRMSGTPNALSLAEKIVVQRVVNTVQVEKLAIIRKVAILRW